MSDSRTKLVGNTGRRKPPAAGLGRPKGAKNKTTKALKDMILGALKDKGGQAYLARQADENPAAFMTLIGKVLPVTLQGDSESPVGIKVIMVPPKRESDG